MNDYVKKTTTIAANDKATPSQTLEYITYFILGIVEILLLFRLVFKLMGANSSGPFVSFIYSVTQLFIIPFAGIFHQTTTPGIETNAVLEPATFVAVFVYAFLAWGITQLIKISSGRLD